MKVLTAAQMREVDRLTTERYGVSSLQLMENAGRGVAACVQRFCGAVDRQRILVLCGRGNNGGDGLVAARELLMLGARPDVLVFAGPGELRGDAGVTCSAGCNWRRSPGSPTTTSGSSTGSG